MGNPVSCTTLNFKVFIIFENLFRNFERWTPSRTGFNKEKLDATLINYYHYPESFVVSENFCS